MRKEIPFVVFVSLLLYWADVSQAGNKVTTVAPATELGLTQPFGGYRLVSVDWSLRAGKRDCGARDRKEGFMKSISKTFGNHDDELGSSLFSQRHSSDGRPANPSNTSLSLAFRER